jgi:acetyltransferase-like isoleucine patch superfamily enzyme
MTANDGESVTEVKRNQWKDKASSHTRKLSDALRAFIKLRLFGKGRIQAGRGVIVKHSVEIRICETGKLIVGDDCIIDSYVYLQLTMPKPTVVLGKFVGLGRGTIIAAKNLITIGDYTQFGPNCQINDQSHGISKSDLLVNQKAVLGEVHIGKDCWFGSGVRVLPDVRIGDGAIIGAGSVVTKDIPSYEIWAGVPAHFLKKRE